MRTRWLLPAGALPALILAGCGAPKPSPPPPPAVTVAAVPEREVTEWDEFTGRLEAVDSVEIRPRVSGYIERVSCSRGQGSPQG